MTVETRQLSFTIEGKCFEATLSVPTEPNPEYAVILTHGAGGSLETGELPPLAAYLAGQGFLCLRFTCRGLNLTYRVKIYYKIVEEFVSSSDFQLKGVFLGGRSMGSRAAVGVANSVKGTPLETCIKGVICLAYPLIGSGKGDMRDEPLFQLTYSCLFVIGDRDQMCPRKPFEKTFKEMQCKNTVCWLAGVGHQFVSKGQEPGEVVNNVCHQVSLWCSNSSKMDEVDTINEVAKNVSARGNSDISTNEKNAEQTSSKSDRKTSGRGVTKSRNSSVLSKRKGGKKKFCDIKKL